MIEAQTIEDRVNSLEKSIRWMSDRVIVAPFVDSHRSIVIYQDQDGTHASLIVEQREHYVPEGSNKMITTSTHTFEGDLVSIEPYDWNRVLDEVHMLQEEKNSSDSLNVLKKWDLNFVEVDMNEYNGNYSWKQAIEKAEKKGVSL